MAKLNKLIEDLQKIQKEHGDLETLVEYDGELIEFSVMLEPTKELNQKWIQLNDVKGDYILVIG